ncbi:MAG: CbtA family protein [Gammaproteobacteria bacterium]|nr:CbtA family protein [Gammaproteobacteria bacterium]
MFRRLIFSAVFVGILSGVIFSAAQHFTITPILLASEVFEQDEPGDAHQHHTDMAMAMAPAQAAQEWAPSDGVERSSYSAGANILAAIGFSSIFLVVMSQLVLRKKLELNVKVGVLSGLLAYAVFFVIPSLGLPPEIPGSSADLLKNRQSWWLMAVVGGAFAALVIIFAPLKYKALGLISVAVPFIIGAPHYDGPMFNHPDPQAVASLEALHQQFIVATGLSNLIFWLVLGLAATLLLKVWVYRQPATKLAND